MNGPVIFLAKGTKAHPSIRGTNLVTTYIFSEGSCVIPNKVSYMDDETWAKVVKVVSPRIRKIKASNFACVLPNLFSLYITLHIYLYKSSADDSLFTSVVGITQI